MGNLLRVLNDKGSTPKIDFFVDFEKAEPTASETEVYEKVNTVLSKAQQILQDLKHIKEQANRSERSISSLVMLCYLNTSHIILVMLCSLTQAISSLVMLCSLTQAISSLSCCVPLLKAIASPSSQKHQDAAWHAAITKQFAEVLDFTLSFDDLKMTNPAIQNDFSYYRRTLNRRKMSQTPPPILLKSEGRAMMLYDHVHPVGAFAKRAGIDMKASIKVIKENANAESAESLLNALRMAVAFALTGFSLLVRTTALALLELVARVQCLIQYTAGWVYSRMGLQQDGSTAGWVYSKMVYSRMGLQQVGLQQDGSTARWVYSRMGLQQDGSTAGWVYSRMGLQQGGGLQQVYSKMSLQQDGSTLPLH
eukprot:Em0179g15a